jgi:hypothetical protein
MNVRYSKKRAEWRLAIFRSKWRLYIEHEKYEDSIAHRQHPKFRLEEESEE